MNQVSEGRRAVRTKKGNWMLQEYIITQFDAFDYEVVGWITVYVTSSRYIKNMFLLGRRTYAV